MKYLSIVLLYAVIINFISSVLTVSDKKRSIKGNFRISEKTLFIFAFLGGAFGEYITMRKIHHKTLHKRFMIGLPLITIVHLALIIGILVLHNYEF
ncbi:MAG: DUF1294 domain-containing protein [Eubacterium sp.]